MWLFEAESILAQSASEVKGLSTEYGAIAGGLIHRRGGLKVLRQAQLPQWRGHFKWQIEEKIQALQAAYARLRAEVAKPDE